MTSWTGVAAMLGALLLAGGAHAETYPTKSVHVIVPFAAGGPTDVIARLVAQRLTEVWGHQVYTENIPGAGGNIAVGMAARAAPDGYTILVVSTGFIVNPSMYTKIPYDPIKDFAPISLVAASPNIVFVNPQVPAKSLKELIDLVKANPGKYSYAQPATGSTPHLAGEMFKQQFNLDLVTVPGLRPERNDIIQVDPPQAYGIVQYARTLDMLARHNWPRRSLFPHGGNQMSLAIAAGFGLGGAESYPGVFGDFGGFADDAKLSDGHLPLSDRPGIGFEGQARLYRIMSELAA